MTPIPTGTERQYDLEVTNASGTTYLLKVLRDPKTGRPLWDVASKPEYSTQAVTGQVEPRQYQSWHLGGGYENLLTAATYHYAINMDCLPGDTSVRSVSSIKGAVRRWYEGDVVQITTASGYQLTATPNHPVLTNRGWVGIGSLKEGDNVFRYSGLKEVPHGADHVHHVNSTIEQVFSLLTEVGASERIAGHHSQFHGDGQESDVNIVTPHSLLENRTKTARCQPIRQDLLSCPHFTSATLKAPCLSDCPIVAMPILSQCLLASETKGASLCSSPLMNGHAPCLKGGSQYTGLGNYIANDLPRHSKRSAQLSHTLSGHVLIDDKVAVNHINGASTLPGNPTQICLAQLRIHGVPGLAGATGCYASALKAFGNTLAVNPDFTTNSVWRHTHGIQSRNFCDIERCRLADGDSRINKALLDTPKVNAEFMGDSLDPLPSSISPENIVSIKRHYFAGHVYNLHTQSGWYIANGIIAHNCRFPRQIIAGPKVTTITLGGSANTVAIFEQSGSVYAAAGRYVKRINQTSDTAEAPNDGNQGKDVTVAVTSAVNFDGNTIVFLGNSNDAYEFTGSVWDTTPGSGTAVAGGYGATLWMDTTYVLARSYADGVAWLPQGSDIDTAADWTAAYLIGDTTTAITNMTAFDRTVFVSKTDGLYYIDRTGRTPKVIDFKSVSTNNGKPLSVDSSGNVWCSTVEGYYRYNSGTGEVWDCSPWRGLPNGSPIYGRVTADAEYKGWRYAWVYNGTDSYLMVGRPREQGEPGVGPYVWHGALAVVYGVSVDCAHISATTTNPRFYFGAGPDLAYFKLPRTGDNPTLDPNVSYASSGSIYMPADNWGVPGGRWCLLGWEVENEGLGSLTYGDFYVRLDGGSWQLLQSCKTSGRSRVAMPSSGDYRFTKAAWRMDFTNAYTTSTPKITAVTGKAESRAPKRDIITTTIDCSDRAYSRYGGQAQYTGREILSALKLMQTSQPVTMVDYWTDSARTQTVMVLDVPERLTEQQGDAPASAVAQITIAVQSSSEADSETAQQPATSSVWGTFVWGVDRWG